MMPKTFYIPYHSKIIILTQTRSFITLNGFLKHKSWFIHEAVMIPSVILPPARLTMPITTNANPVK